MGIRNGEMLLSEAFLFLKCLDSLIAGDDSPPRAVEEEELDLEH